MKEGKNHFYKGKNVIEKTQIELTKLSNKNQYVPTKTRSQKHK